MKTQYILALVGMLAVMGGLVFFGLNKVDKKAEIKNNGNASSTQTSSESGESQAVAALNEFIEPDTYKTAKRSEGALTALIGGPSVLQVGQRASYILNVFNSSYQSLPEAPYEFHQKTATFLTAGPITLSNKKGNSNPDVLMGKRTYDDFNETQVFFVTCNAVGNATITFQTKGTSGATTPESNYSITVDFPLMCVAKKEESSSNSALDEKTETGQVYKLGEEYPDAKKQFTVVYTIDGLPYAQGQFQYAEPEKSVSETVGCPFWHVHSNVTVHPFQQWFIRGNPDLGLQTNVGISLTDPAPDKCGFGRDGGQGPKSVFVPEPHFVEMCSRFDLDNVGTAENFDTRRTSELQELCANLGN